MGDHPKVVLVQLPHPAYLNRNIPLAAGNLKAAAYQSQLLDRVDISILNPRIASYGGDAVIVDSIASMMPDVVGFSFYLWNASRSIHIIRRLRAKLPDVKIIVGGPEIREDGDYLESCPEVDIGFIGEGEFAFVQWLKHITDNKPNLEDIPGISYCTERTVILNSSPTQKVDVNEIPSPYLLGYIDPRDYGHIAISTMLGCPFACKYCSWTSRGRLRPYSIERLYKEVELAIKAGVSSLYIQDSAFNISPVFEEFCSCLSSLNANKVVRPICFLQAEIVHQRTVDLLRQAHFAGVELGLQSTNPLAMANINRRFDMERFLRAVHLLREAEIPITVDVILGLPGDTLDGFEKTMGFVKGNHLNYMVFNLSLGHGNQLRGELDTFGAQIQTKPPFYVLRTSTFSNDELKSVLVRHDSADNNRIHDLSYPVIRSRCSCADMKIDVGKISSPITNIVLEVDSSQSLSHLSHIAGSLCRKVGSALSLLIVCERLSPNVEMVKAFVDPIARANPHLVWDILLQTKKVPSMSEIREIESCVHRESTFLDNRNIFLSEYTEHPYRTSINVFAVPIERVDLDRICNCNLIYMVEINGFEDVSHAFKSISSISPIGVLIDLGSNVTPDMIWSILQAIQKNNIDEQSVFFTDWVIQYIWNSRFSNVTTHNSTTRSELLINRESSIFHSLFDRSDLLWDAVFRWHLVKDEYSHRNVEDILMSKLANEVAGSNPQR